MSRSRSAAALCIAILGLAFVGVMGSYRDFGMTWDEGVQAEYGVRVVEYFRSGGGDERANEFLDLRFYGPLFEAATALITESSEGARAIEIRHLCIALSGLVGVAASMFFASALRFDAWLAPLAGIALVTMPRFWGHMFANSKDIPFTAAFAISMVAIVVSIGAREQRWRWALVAALAFGLTAAIRPGGLPLLLLIFGLALLGPMLQRQTERSSPLAHALHLAAELGVVLALAWIAMILPWPWAHEAWIANPLAAMRQAAAFSQAYPVLFEGRVIPSDQLPARYLLQYLWITTPPLLLALAPVGWIVSVREQWLAPRGRQAVALLVLQLWLALPLALYLVFRPNVYDGIRHFLFVLPAVAVFAALGICGVTRFLSSPRARATAIVLLGASLLWPLPRLVDLHPYQATYFNVFVGGLSGAEGRYETDYWLSSYKEAMEWINDRAPREGEEPLRVAIAANFWSRPCAETYAAANVELFPIFGLAQSPNLPDGIDYYVSTYRYGFAKNFPDAPILHSIGRDGAVFTVIKGRGEGS